MNTLYPLLNNATALFFPAGIALTAGIVRIALIGVIIIARLMGPIVGVILVCVMIALLLGMGFIGNTAHGKAPSLEVVGVFGKGLMSLPLSKIGVWASSSIGAEMFCQRANELMGFF